MTNNNIEDYFSSNVISLLNKYKTMISGIADDYIEMYKDKTSAMLKEDLVSAANIALIEKYSDINLNAVDFKTFDSDVYDEIENAIYDEVCKYFTRYNEFISKMGLYLIK